MHPATGSTRKNVGWSKAKDNSQPRGPRMLKVTMLPVVELSGVSRLRYKGVARGYGLQRLERKRIPMGCGSKSLVSSSGNQQTILPKCCPSVSTRTHWNSSFKSCLLFRCCLRMARNQRRGRGFCPSGERYLIARYTSFRKIRETDTIGFASAIHGTCALRCLR